MKKSLFFLLSIFLTLQLLAQNNSVLDDDCAPVPLVNALILENGDIEVTWESPCDTVEVIWGFELPFLENWDSGNFEFNDWHSYSDNWLIDPDFGNEEPSVKYTNIESNSNYQETLYSTYFNAHELTEGNIWLNFKLKLDDAEADSSEFMSINIYDGNIWETVYIRANTGSFDWDRVHLDITPYSMSKAFQIAFEASGTNNQNIQNWFIDNIEIYRSCPSACDFAVDIDTVGYDEYTVKFTWGPCDTVLPDGQWMQWDDGTNCAAIGTACPPTTAAVRWDANMLPEFDGFKISKLKFFFDEADIDYLKPLIWQGQGAANLIYADSLTPENINLGWNTIEINPPLSWDVEDELWIGYECDYPIGFFPHGNDQGPAVVGYGDLIQCGGDWDTLSNLGYDNNFNLSMFLLDSSGREFRANNSGLKEIQEYSGINIYRSVNGEEYMIIDFVPYVEGEIYYPTPIEGDGILQCYKFTNVFESETDYCESAPFTARDNPEEDFVCFLLTGNDESTNIELNHVDIFPNPATNQLNIQSEETIEEIRLINQIGQTVHVLHIDNKQFTINTSGLKEGIYIVMVKTDKGVLKKRIVITN